MYRNKIVVLLVSALYLISGCSLPGLGGNESEFPVVKDTSMRGKYAKTEKYAGIVTRAMFDHFMAVGRNSIVTNKDLNNKNKKVLLKDLERNHYKKNKYLYFTMVYNTQYLDDELKLKFSIYNHNNRNLYAGDELIYEKLYMYGALASVNYSYVIKCKNNITEEIKKGNVRLVVKYPDGTSTIFKVKM